MPHTPSAWKRLRKSETRRKQNRTAAKKIRLQRRKVADAIKGTDAAAVVTEVKATQAVLDRAASKGYIHPNKAARLKSRLVKRQRAAAAAPPKAETTKK
ncbi:30S ribosomal protein S20 [Gemmata sp.]|uniref:30S ribosomal protein S20 n=1 Tax=Gemmata sp. TaxID=1914242 RepID=UPI003F6F6ED7